MTGGCEGGRRGGKLSVILSGGIPGLLESWIDDRLAVSGWRRQGEVLAVTHRGTEKQRHG